ncbi:phasin family protein [Marinobacter orientalis]|uniref:Phasin domain-containing protein n=1 Tax=Marinobacter orientalis TaxID=1928859 RepID=A0A7Y0REV1_9GAMM|nr:phasin family protein [Marinobacter orientalis]NMT64954.1 hypothetical protein [Marinobacter orientalis]TGX48152.1 hypothetical protein DIT72_16165 [Marinobacter orientalis]
MVTDTFTLSSEPLNRLNRLVMDTCQRAADAQMTSLYSYMALLEDQTREAAAIRNFKGIKGFLGNQPTRVKQVITRMSEDRKQFSEIAENFRNGAFELFRARVVANPEGTYQPKADVS